MKPGRPSTSRNRRCPRWTVTSMSEMGQSRRFEHAVTCPISPEERTFPTLISSSRTCQQQTPPGWKVEPHDGCIGLAEHGKRRLVHVADMQVCALTHDCAPDAVGTAGTRTLRPVIPRSMLNLWTRGRVYRMLVVITVCSTTAIRNGRVYIGLPSTKINTTAGRTDP